ncbi:transcriptional regulator [Klebsiella variicola]|nr:transcriptional regulator [Klebsiella variicola]
MNDPDFNLLAAVDGVLAEESVAGAARRLGFSTSAISRTLTRLRHPSPQGIVRFPLPVSTEVITVS